MTGILFALALLASSPCADAGRAVEPTPAPPPFDVNTWYGSLYDWAGGYEAAPLGVGHLALEGREDTWDWWIKVVLPLYESLKLFVRHAELRRILLNRGGPIPCHRAPESSSHGRLDDSQRSSRLQDSLVVIQTHLLEHNHRLRGGPRHG